MAVETTVTIIDDMSAKAGKPVKGAAEKGFVQDLQFMLDGDYFQIDLGPANKKALHEALTPFMEAARKVDPPKRAGKSGFQLTDNQKAWHQRALAWGRTSPDCPEDLRPKGGWMASKPLQMQYKVKVPTDPYPED